MDRLGPSRRHRRRWRVSLVTEAARCIIGRRPRSAFRDSHGQDRAWTGRTHGAAHRRYRRRELRIAHYASPDWEPWRPWTRLLGRRQHLRSAQWFFFEFVEFRLFE